MPGGSFTQGSQPVEFVEESTFATLEADAEYNWIGFVTSYNGSTMVEEDVFTYLPDDATGNDLQTIQAEKVSELHEVDMTYRPQDLDFFQYFTGAIGDTDPELSSLQFGEQNRNEGTYRRSYGAVGEEISLTIEEDSIAEVDASFTVAAQEDWSTTDYVGTGSHASEDPATPLMFDDLSNVLWGGASLDGAVDSLTLTISNDLVVVKDPDAGLDSHVDGIVPVDREIDVELGITYDGFNMANNIRSFVKQDLTFDFGPNDESWTINDVAFPEFPYEFTADDLVADSVTSVRCSGLSYA